MSTPEKSDTVSPTFKAKKRLVLELNFADCGVDMAPDLRSFDSVRLTSDDTPEMRAKFIRLFRNFAEYLEGQP